MSIISVEQVSKEFRLGQLQGLRSFFFRLAGKAPTPSSFLALDNIDFSIANGEVVGLIGTNGAGKSTLLKLIAGISKPSRGKVTVKGRVAPLIEVGAGLVGELSGRENIYLNGSILGMSREEIHRKFDDIVGFAELEKFIDTPIKRYSSGMQVRIGFAIATAVEADILIVDEVLAVGDLAFQRKCFDRMEDLIKRRGSTVLLVTHNVRQVEKLCTRAIMLEGGQVIADGAPADVCTLFYERMETKIKHNVAQTSSAQARIQGSGNLQLISMQLLDAQGGATDRVRHQGDVTVSILYSTAVPLVRPTFGIGVHTTDFLYLATHNSEQHYRDEILQPGTYELRCTIRRLPFLPGIYSLRLGIASGDLMGTLFYGENLCHFQVEAPEAARSGYGTEGFVPLEVEWQPVHVHALERTGG